MANPSQPQSSKPDIATILNEIAKLYNAQKKWKQEIIDRQQVWKDEIIRHFDVAVETIRHDLLGADHDEIEGIKDRVTRLERHTGLVTT